jgi:hypothetical protein
VNPEPKVQDSPVEVVACETIYKFLRSLITEAIFVGIYRLQPKIIRAKNKGSIWR